MLDRSTKLLIAITALVASTFLVINHIVRRDPIEDWFLAGVLFLVSAGFWVWMWAEDQAEEEETALTVAPTQTPVAAQPQEWIISKDRQPATPSQQAQTAAQSVDKAADAVAKQMDKTEKPEKSTPDHRTDVITPEGQDDRESVLQDSETETPNTAEPVEERGPKPGDEEVTAEDVVEEIVETGGATEKVEEAENGSTPEADAVGDAMAAPQSDDAAREAEEAKDIPKTRDQVTEPDDLTRIEGIGPRYSTTLMDAGLNTFDKIANSNEAELSRIISEAGMRRPTSVGTWTEQAAFAAAGDWEGLAAFQKTLTGGRRD